MAVLDFTASRQRIEARAEHSIEIAARAIPVELEFTPRATLIERMAARMSNAELADAIHVALQESL